MLIKGWIRCMEVLKGKGSDKIPQVLKLNSSKVVLSVHLDDRENTDPVCTKSQK
jgi:hypothetical protein